MGKIDIDPLVSAFVDNTLKGMQDLVRKGEEVCPQIILFGREGDASAIIPLVGIGQYFESKEKKRQLRSLVKNVWKQISSSKPEVKLTAVVTLSDAWVEYVSRPEFEKITQNGRDKPFVEKPGMAEALMIIVSVADGELQYQWDYVRAEEGVVFAAEPEVAESPSNGPKGMAMGLWPLDSK